MVSIGVMGRVVLISALMVAASLGIMSVSTCDVAAYSTHQPILINGDANFTSANGVVSGSGSQGNPYVISGWEIYSNIAHGIDIRNTASHFEIRDVYIHGGTSSNSGIHIEWSHNALIENATLTSNTVGVDLWYCYDMTVTGNTVSNCVWGIFTVGCNNVILDGNSISENEYYGVMLWDSTYMTLTDNFFTDDGISIDGTFLEAFTTHSIPQNNLVNSAGPIMYIRNQSDIDLSNLSVGQLIVVNCQGGRLVDVGATRTNAGIETSYCSNISIESCDITFSYQGINVQHSSNMMLLDNRIWFGNEGIRIGDGDGVTVAGNQIVGNQRGLILNECGNLTALDNNITSNFNAVEAYDCKDSSIVGNMIGDSEFTSILLTTCSNVIVAENRILTSWGISLFSSDYVRIFHNSFVDLRYECQDVNGTHNKWNGEYPLGGNYWSDATVTDNSWGPGQNLTGSDGLGDARHFLSGESGPADRYPLVSEWTHEGYLIASYYVYPRVANDTSETFHFDASSTVYLLSPLVSPEVRWDWENDGSWDVDWSSSMELDHAYPGEGVYSIHLEVRAENLNDSEFHAAVVDMSRPTITWNWINETVHSGAVTIGWLSGDNYSGIGYCEYSLDGGTWHRVTGNIGQINLTGLADGKHVFAVRAVDNAGNMIEENIVIVVNTSILSPGGPYGPWVLILLIIAIIAVIGIVILALQSRCSRGP